MASDATSPRLAEAQALFANDKVELALVQLRALLSENGDDLAALALMIEAGSSIASRYEKPKWRAAATKALEDLRADGDMGEETAVRIGWLMLTRGEISVARSVAGWLIRRFPTSVATALFLHDLYRQIGDNDAAMGALQTAVATHPTDPQLNLRIAQRLIAAGRGVEALAYAKALKKRDSSPAAILALARARIAIGEPDVASALILRTTGAAPLLEVLPAVRDLIDSGYPAVAENVIDSLRVRFSNEAVLLRLKADIRQADGRKAEAASLLHQALATGVNREDFARLASLQIELGDIAGARETLVRMQDAYPRELAPGALRGRVQEAEGLEAKAEKTATLLAERAARSVSMPMARQPVALAGIIGSHGLGDFVYQLLALASLKRQFSDARLTLIYSNERAYKNEVLRFCADIDHLQDYADGAMSVKVATKDHSYRQHMVFTQAGLSPTLLTRLDRTATFVTPSQDVDRLTAGLVERGLDPTRWFLAMHYRSSASFSARMVGGRDVDPRAFHRLAEAVCRQGGQVVRLGHPGLDPIPNIPGYVDIADASISQQLFAVSKARFMVACDSGPTSFATAFKTPLLKTNAFTDDGAFYAGDLILAKNIVNWRGEVLSMGEALADRVLFFKALTATRHDFRLVDNSLEQLLHGVGLMTARTADGGWRADPAPDLTPPPEAIAWPTETRRRSEVLDLAHLLGLPVRAVSLKEPAP